MTYKNRKYRRKKLVCSNRVLLMTIVTNIKYQNYSFTV
jgi:hypothetical protein